MKIVDEKAQAQRSEKMSIILTAFLVCIPVLGMFIGLFTVVPALFATILTKSANRIYDLVTLFILLALYFIVPLALFYLFVPSGLSWQVSYTMPIIIALIGQFVITYVGLKRFW